MESIFTKIKLWFLNEIKWVQEKSIMNKLLSLIFWNNLIQKGLRKKIKKWIKFGGQWKKRIQTKMIEHHLE